MDSLAKSETSPLHVESDQGKNSNLSSDERPDANKCDEALESVSLSQPESRSEENLTDLASVPNGHTQSAKQDTQTLVCSQQSLLGASQSALSDIEEESEAEGESGSADSTKHKSIIKHLLSQVRVGMDLTRFSLPAFLLAPHSMLHVYASLFGRPHLITELQKILLFSAADQTTPSGRMTAVVRWFLSSLSSSRKDPVPKKPYNPILGETFNCYWDPPGVKSNPDHERQTLLETGPFPQASNNSFTFLTEQVSHHPPVSALYGECISKKMCVSATICTRTKLTASLAVKAHNAGMFRIFLLEHDEEYTTALPDTFIRGVLTTPWFEFGGECVIDCVKSGHSAKIIFHTKSKVSKRGKKNGVSGELKLKSDKKPYMTFEGEWDSQVHSKTPDGKTELFFEACTPTFPKMMKKLSCASPTDSRVVWRQLTDTILAKDDQAAADAKHQIEENQREKARERSKTGDVFKQQFFHQSEEDSSIWEFNSPLNERLQLQAATPNSPSTGPPHTVQVTTS